MKRSAIAIVLVLATVAAIAAPGASARAQQGALTHCSNTRYAPMYLTIKRIAARGTGCSTARALSLAYMRAVTQSIGAHPHTGHCFGAQSYGHCGVTYRGRPFDCFHFDFVPEKTRGLVRCSAESALVKFNIGS